jgi:hypothetical protein
MRSQGRARGRGGKPQKGRRLRKEEMPARSVGKAPKHPGLARLEVQGSKGGFRSRRRAQARPGRAGLRGTERLRGGWYRGFPTPGARRALEGRTSGGQGCGPRFGARGTALREEEGSEVARRALAGRNDGGQRSAKRQESTGLERGRGFPGKSKALKAEPQERYRGETDPEGVAGRKPSRA